MGVSTTETFPCKCCEQTPAPCSCPETGLDPEYLVIVADDSVVTSQVENCDYQITDPNPSTSKIVGAGIYLQTTPCSWEMDFDYFDPETETSFSGTYRKTTGLTPVGVYELVDCYNGPGCPPSVEVIEIVPP
jgi:hypothetical protein